VRLEPNVAKLMASVVSSSENYLEIFGKWTNWMFIL